jgi:hypothetical protein
MDRLVDGRDRQLKLIEGDVAAFGLTKREALSKRDALRKMTNERLRMRGLERTSVAASAAASPASFACFRRSPAARICRCMRKSSTRALYNSG